MQILTQFLTWTKPDVNRAPRRVASMLTGIALALTVVKFSAARKYGPPRAQ